MQIVRMKLIPEIKLDKYGSYISKAIQVYLRESDEKKLD
jgi:hypothetical protein